jgi:phosphohistidine phosphatase
VRLIIVRHGKAEADPPSHSGRDEDRRLKKRGERQARWLATRFADDPPALILSSGHERAVATARLIHEGTGSLLEREPRLELGSTASEALQAIAQRVPRDGALMLVGHNPQLSHLIGILAGGLPGSEFDLHTGEAVIMDFDRDVGPGGAAVVERLRLAEDD